MSSESDDKTDLMEEDEEGSKTEYIDEEATGILQEIQDFVDSKHIIEIVEEQTSL